MFSLEALPESLALGMFSTNRFLYDFRIVEVIIFILGHLIHLICQTSFQIGSILFVISLISFMLLRLFQILIKTLRVCHEQQILKFILNVLGLLLVQLVLAFENSLLLGFFSLPLKLFRANDWLCVLQSNFVIVRQLDTCFTITFFCEVSLRIRIIVVVFSLLLRLGFDLSFDLKRDRNEVHNIDDVLLGFSGCVFHVHDFFKLIFPLLSTIVIDFFGLIVHLDCRLV